MAAAAQDAGRPIGVHFYLFKHYDDPWGWECEDSRELQVKDRLALPVPGQCSWQLLLTQLAVYHVCQHLLP